jgi:hypothetical protein
MGLLAFQALVIGNKIACPAAPGFEAAGTNARFILLKLYPLLKLFTGFINAALPTLFALNRSVSSFF